MHDATGRDHMYSVSLPQACDSCDTPPGLTTALAGGIVLFLGGVYNSNTAQAMHESTL